MHQSVAEVDFLLAPCGRLLSVEVKSAPSGALKSLHQFLWRAGSEVVVRLHSGSAADERHQVNMQEGILHYQLLSLPLYLASQVPTLFHDET